MAGDRSMCCRFSWRDEMIDCIVFSGGASYRMLPARFMQIRANNQLGVCWHCPREGSLFAGRPRLSSEGQTRAGTGLGWLTRRPSSALAE